MNKLPIEIENDIWNLYYMDIFKNTCINELDYIIQLSVDIEDIKEAMFKFLRIYRFNDVCNKFTINQIRQHKINFKENCLKLEKIFKFLDNKKVFRKILYLSHFKKMNHILDNMIEKSFQDKYYFTIKFILHNCNYQKKLISRLKFLLS